jgi:hypothetical protein
MPIIISGFFIWIFTLSTSLFPDGPPWNYQNKSIIGDYREFVFPKDVAYVTGKTDEMILIKPIVLSKELTLVSIGTIFDLRSKINNGAFCTCSYGFYLLRISDSNYGIPESLFNDPDGNFYRTFRNTDIIDIVFLKTDSKIRILGYVCSVDYLGQFIEKLFLVEGLRRSIQEKSFSISIEGKTRYDNSVIKPFEKFLNDKKIPFKAN